MSRAVISMLLGLSACTWVSKQDVDERLPELDDDQDSFPASDDCDDNDAAVYPGAPETWYDGIDADCAGDDDFDQDKDTFGREVDCDDTSAAAFPGGTEVWYDGIDGDCGGDDDYDQDKDGFVRAEDAGKATAAVPGSGALPEGDCDDTLDLVNPSATDTAYDGQDTNCSGNDDYDQDLDGYVADIYEGLLTQYVDTSGDLLGGDCDDADGAIYPGAADAWYDGIDSDCAENDDFDQDVDGQRALAEGAGEDCDDLDADIYYGATEIVGDGVDMDCDGGEASFLFDDLNLEATLEIDTPLDVRLASNSTDLYLSFAVQEITFVEPGVESTYYSSAIALLYDLALLHDEPVAEVVPWVATTTLTSASATGGHDILVTDYGLIGAIGLTNAGSSRTFRLGGYDLGLDDIFGQSYSVSGISDPLSQVSIARDGAGNAHFIGCSEDGTLMYLWMDMEDCDSAGTLNCWGPTNQSQVLDLPGWTCGVEFDTEADEGLIHLGQEDGYTIARFDISEPGKYTYDDDPEVTEYDFIDTYLPSSMKIIEDADGVQYRVFYDEASQSILALDEDDVEIEIDVDVAETTPVRAVFGPDGRLFVVYIEDGDAVLTYGTLAGTRFTGATTLLPTDFAPDQAELWVGDATGSGATDLVVALAASSEIAVGMALVAD